MNQEQLKILKEQNPFAALHDLISDLIMQDIISFRIAPGSRLVENALAEGFGQLFVIDEYHADLLGGLGQNVVERIEVPAVILGHIERFGKRRVHIIGVFYLVAVQQYDLHQSFPPYSSVKCS